MTRLTALLIAAISLAGCAKSVQSSAVQPPSGISKTFDRQVRNAVDAGDGDFEARQLRARLDANPSDTATRLELARHYQKSGFPEIAIEHCRLACERDPESAEARLTLGKMLRDARRPAEGAEVLAKFAATHNSDVEIQAWLGLLLDEAGDWKAGEVAHRKAIALSPTRDDLRNNLGYCLLEQGRNAEAAEEFRAALKVNPRSEFARNNLGVALAADPKEAILNLQSLASPADAHSNLAAVLIEQGKYAEARRELDLALGYNRQHSAALNNLRLVSELDGKPTEIRSSSRPSARWARVRTQWRHLWGIKESDGKENESGTAVASR